MSTVNLEETLHVSLIVESSSLASIAEYELTAENFERCQDKVNLLQAILTQLKNKLPVYPIGA